MSEQQKAARQDEQEQPDVEGHRFLGAEEPQKTRLNDDEPDESQDTGEGRLPR